MYTLVYIHMYVFVYVYIYTHTHTHTLSMVWLKSPVKSPKGVLFKVPKVHTTISTNCKIYNL